MDGWMDGRRRLPAVILCRRATLSTRRAAGIAFPIRCLVEPALDLRQRQPVVFRSHRTQFLPPAQFPTVELQTRDRPMFGLLRRQMPQPFGQSFLAPARRRPPTAARSSTAAQEQKNPNAGIWRSGSIAKSLAVSSGPDFVTAAGRHPAVSYTQTIILFVLSGGVNNSILRSGAALCAAAIPGIAP